MQTTMKTLKNIREKWKYEEMKTSKETVIKNPKGVF